MVKNPLTVLTCLFCAYSALKIGPNSPYLDTNLPQEGVSAPPPILNDSVTIAGVTGNAGMIQVLEDGSSMFYWFFNRLGGNITTDSVPLVMWLQGGPGCSSMCGNLFEFGPLYIDETLTPQRSPQTWASEFHLLFVDNPFGAGYSYAIKDTDYVTTEEEMATNLYSTLQQLCRMHSPWFTGREFYVFGESYAGKYIPFIATTIILGNMNSSNCYIPLGGLGIGDGSTDPVVQTMAYADFAFAAGLIDESERAEVELMQWESVEDFNNGDLNGSNDRSNDAVNLIVKYGGDLNMYNVREFGDYNTTLMDTWLNLNSTKALLNVPLTARFRDCGWKAYNALNLDEMLSATYLLPFLFNHTKVMFYNGQDDLICNASGTELYLSLLAWYGQYQYLSAQKNTWYVNGQVAGYERGYDNVTMVVVLKSGHMVPRDQPINSLDMVRRFVYDLGWDSE